MRGVFTVTKGRPINVRAEYLKASEKVLRNRFLAANDHHGTQISGYRREDGGITLISVHFTGGVREQGIAIDLTYEQARELRNWLVFAKKGRHVCGALKTGKNLI